MTKKIEQTITDVEVVQSPQQSSQQESSDDDQQTNQQLTLMHEKIERGEVLEGKTYKIKPPETATKHAVFVTINHVVLESEGETVYRPYEIFLNTKDTQYIAWMSALTRVISAVFQKGGEVSFLTEELKNVHDPEGGYFKPRYGYMPSLVAEIGHVIERHLHSIGVIEFDEPDPHQQAYLAQKREQLAREQDEASDNTSGLKEGYYCDNCHNYTKYVIDGCLTCIECGDSKCS